MAYAPGFAKPAQPRSAGCARPPARMTSLPRPAGYDRGPACQHESRADARARQQVRRCEQWDCSTGSSTASSAPSTVPSPRPSSPRSSRSRSPPRSAAPWTTAPPSWATAAPSCPTSSRSSSSDTDYDRLSGYEEELENELVAAAQEHAESQRYQPGGPLQVNFASADDLETGVFRVRTATARRPGAAPKRGEEGYAAAPAPSPAAPPAAAPVPRPRHTDDDGLEATQRQAPVAPPAQPRRVNPADRPWLDIDGERYPLMGAITVIGRDDSADIVLDDPGISRRHCEIRVTNDGPHLVASIRDLGSTNGTFVNGERITSRAWTTGTGSPSGAPTPSTAPDSGDARMSELTLTIIRLGLLALLWVFVLSVVGVLRGDLYGTRSSAARRASRAPRAAQPARPRRRRARPHPPKRQKRHRIRRAPLPGRHRGPLTGTTSRCARRARSSAATPSAPSSSTTTSPRPARADLPPRRRLVRRGPGLDQRHLRRHERLTGPVRGRGRHTLRIGKTVSSCGRQHAMAIALRYAARSDLGLVRSETRTPGMPVRTCSPWPTAWAATPPATSRARSSIGALVALDGESLGAARRARLC